MVAVVVRSEVVLDQPLRQAGMAVNRSPRCISPLLAARMVLVLATGGGLALSDRAALDCLFGVNVHM